VETLSAPAQRHDQRDRLNYGVVVLLARNHRAVAVWNDAASSPTSDMITTTTTTATATATTAAAATTTTTAEELLVFVAP